MPQEPHPNFSDFGKLQCRILPLGCCYRSVYLRQCRQTVNTPRRPAAGRLIFVAKCTEHAETGGNEEQQTKRSGSLAILRRPPRGVNLFAKPQRPAIVIAPTDSL